MKRLRVLVLMHDELVPPNSLEGLTEEEIHPFRMEWDVLQGLRELGHEVRVLGLTDEMAPIRQAVEEWQPHLAFNLLMHFHDVGVYDAHVVSYLELLKLPYTGCNPRGLLLAGDKALCKKILNWHRIRVPGFAVFRRGKVARLPKRLSLPLIVKSVAEHASIGIAQASVVRDEEALQERVTFIHERVGTDAIAEEYIEGRELYVGILGNQRLEVLPAWELTFESLPAGSKPIATSKAKWDIGYQKRIGLETGPAEIPAETEKALPRLARRIYRALDLTGFARIDLRMDGEGKIYVLEANPNPDLCRNEDFARSAEAAGIDYLQLLQKLLNLGLRHVPAWKTD